jgi:hypothetical protein
LKTLFLICSVLNWILSHDENSHLKNLLKSKKARQLVQL